MGAGADRRILHCDMDCFYAAVHVRDDPSLAGRPVMVGGDPGGRGVVASASYEARSFGVRSAMSAARADRLCPQGVFLRPDFPRYLRESQHIFAIFRQFTERIQTVALDEAYLDVTHCLDRWGSATAIAREIRRRVREMRGLVVSVGAGPSKLVAKIASDRAKPDGLLVVRPERVRGFLDPLPVRVLPGVGPATEEVLHALGLRLVGELRKSPVEVLERRLGRHGRSLHGLAQGVDERPVEERQERKSLGKETTFQRDLRDPEVVTVELDRLAQVVADGLQRRQLAACTVTVKVRYADFTTITRSRTVRIPTASSLVLGTLARDLLQRTQAAVRPVRLLGLAASTLLPADGEQLVLFAEG